jgi:glycosyltransferase involved in cell wall biosynthesis
VIVSSDKRIRVLQVVHGLGPGGIETWLLNVLRAIDRNHFQMDFVTSAPEPCFYDDAVRQLGAKIHFCPAPQSPWVYAPALFKTIRKEKYDVVHTHLDHFSGFVLRVAELAGVPKRIAHSHTDTLLNQANAGIARKTYLWAMKRWLRRSATQGLAVSDVAGKSLFPNWGHDQRWQLQYCGIDTQTFHEQPAENPRAQFGIAPDALVIGHVGGFREPKNHSFLVEIAAQAVRQNPKVHLLLVGDGPLRPSIEEKVHALGLNQHVIFTGYISDPRILLRDLFDVFLFPSLWEGLPLAVLEAQAAGVPCVLSDRISTEVEVVTPLITRLSLDEPAERWAKAVLSAATTELPAGCDPLGKIEKSGFSMRDSVNALQEIYAAN